MKRIDDLNLAQRLVLVAASGLVIHVLVLWLVAPDTPSGGWFGYAPATQALFRSPNRRFSTAVTAFVLILGIAAWTAISLRLLAKRRGPD